MSDNKHSQGRPDQHRPTTPQHTTEKKWEQGKPSTPNSQRPTTGKEQQRDSRNTKHTSE